MKLTWGQVKSSRVVVLSVDGMRPDFYRRPDAFRLRLPNILGLVESGASADAVESVYPTTTYPAHATLVTGVPPKVHGVYSHLASLDPTEPSRPWHWFARAIRVPTLWTAARATERKTAAVSWPVSAGGAIEHNIPEIWDPAAPNPQLDLETAARHATPGLFPEVVAALRLTLTNPSPDRLRGQAAVYLWKKYQPDLLLVHFVSYDQRAHKHGPLSPEALAALEEIDEEVGRFREAIALSEPVALVVLSDHGFVPVEQEAAPLVLMAEEGLFDFGTGGRPQLKRLGAIHAGGSFAVYWLEEPTSEERRALDRAVERLRASGAVAEVVDREKLESLQADPDAELILDAAPGFYFSDRFEGPVVRPTVKDHGTHGQLPWREGLEAGFIAVGPGIAAGKNVGHITLADVGRTLAGLLGLPAETLAAHTEPLDLS